MKVGMIFIDIEVGEEVEQCRDSKGGAILQPWTVDALTDQFGVGEKGFSPGDLKAHRQLLYQNICALLMGRLTREGHT